MTTTDIHASFAPHKMWEERESETTHACKAAFQTDAHTGEMSSQNAPDQPRQPRSQGHDGGMQCSWLAWVAAQDDLPLNLQGFLARLARLADADGRITMTQAQIAASVKLSERQTRTLLREAVTSTALKRERRGGAGAGRISDVLTLNHERNATDAMLPAAKQPEDSATDQPPPLARDATDATLPVAGCSSLPEAPANGASLPVDNKNPAHIRNAGARAEPLTNITLPLELNPEPEEASGKGVVLPPDQKTEPPPEEPPKKARAKTAYSSDFEAVWKLWPSNRRGNSDKKLAFKRYQQGVIDYGAEKIEAAARRYLSLPDTRKENFQFCCLVEVFMNGKLEAAVEAIEDAPSAAFIEPHERNGIRPRAF